MTSLRAGDVVCFIGSQRDVVAHRLVAVLPDGAQLLVQGDRDGRPELVPFTAVVGRVTTVRKGPMGYRTVSLTGRAMGHVALERRRLHRVLVIAAKLAVSVRGIIGFR